MDKKPLLGSKSRTKTNKLDFEIERTILSKKKRYSEVNLKIEID